MQVGKARFFFRIALGAALLSLFFTFLLAMTLLTRSISTRGEAKLQVLAQFFAQPRKSSELIVATPFESKIGLRSSLDPDRAILDEMLARYYVENRYSVIPDKQEMNYRWGWSSPLLRLSTSSVHTDVVGKDLEARLEKLKDVKTVEIIQVNRNNAQFNIDFIIHTLSETGVVSEELRNVVMDFGYHPSFVSRGSAFSNPFGLYFWRIRGTAKKRSEI